MKPSIPFLAALPILIAGCAYNPDIGVTSESEKAEKAEKAEIKAQQQLREVFESNVEKVPLFYRSQQHFDPDYAAPPRDAEDLLGKFENYAKRAAGTGYLEPLDRSAGILIDGKPTLDLEGKALVFNALWDTETPICIGQGQCHETPDEIKEFVVVFTQHLTVSDMVCRNPLTWRYLAYGASAVYHHSNADGEPFYTHRLDINNCPTNKDNFALK